MEVGISACWRAMSSSIFSPSTRPSPGSRGGVATTQWRSLFLARSSEASAEHGAAPPQGSQVRLARGQARQDHLPGAELSRTCQGRLPARQHSEIPHHLHARRHLARAAWAADHSAQGVRDARLRGRADFYRWQARQASERRERLFLHRRILVLTICGSLRKGSYNAMVQRALVGLAPEGMPLKAAPSYAETGLWVIRAIQAVDPPRALGPNAGVRTCSVPGCRKVDPHRAGQPPPPLVSGKNTGKSLVVIYYHYPSSKCNH